MLICSQNGGFSGFVVSAKFPDNFLYFWDAENWNVEEAYKAFGKEMKTIYSLDEIENVFGRIWVLDSGSFELLKDIQERYDVNLIQQKEFDTTYHLGQYSFSLIEK